MTSKTHVKFVLHFGLMCIKPLHFSLYPILWLSSRHGERGEREDEVDITGGCSLVVSLILKGERYLQGLQWRNVVYEPP